MNIFDPATGKNKPIFFRTKPFRDAKGKNLLSKSEQYTIDPLVAASLNLLKTSDDYYLGQISSDELKTAIESKMFLDAANVPTLTGTNAIDYQINAPIVDHVQYEFKLSTEGSGQFKSALDFKTAHPNLNVKGGSNS